MENLRAITENNLTYRHKINGVNKDIPLKLNTNFFVLTWNDKTQPFITTNNYQTNPTFKQQTSFTDNLKKYYNLKTVCFKSLVSAKKEQNKRS